jgi:signal transduction histidine kinase
LATALALTFVVRTRQPHIAAVVSALPLLVTVGALSLHHEGQSTIALALALHACAIGFGLVSRSAERVRDRVKGLERDCAVADERDRLARELHDSVGHAVSVMLTHAGAARLSLPNGAHTAYASLRQIERAGKVAMDDLDRVLALLGSPGQRLPLHTRLDGLAAGLDGLLQVEVRYHEESGSEPAPHVVADAVHRLVQESLTNTVKHSRASRVAVLVEVKPEVVSVDVRDHAVVESSTLSSIGGGNNAAAGTRPGERPAPSSDITGRGRGLLGMQSRVQDLGGSFSAGPEPGGGWRVRADFPRQTSAGSVSA